ncbi:MAG TPA: tail fiber protein [Ferruginibacter sp.]|nr:tail fiber protein [Ferruginibacter sp.]
MGQPYVGEIRMFGGNFNPAGWMFCDGAVLPISENEVLFQLIGTSYGGDGEETFALPDLRGRVPIHMGQGPGLPSSYQIAENGGVESVTLTIAQMPSHNHTPLASNAGGSDTPTNNFWANSATAKAYGAAPTTVVMNAATIASAGGNLPHDNMIPFLGINYIISLFGIFPHQ